MPERRRSPWAAATISDPTKCTFSRQGVTSRPRGQRRHSQATTGEQPIQQKYQKLAVEFRAAWAISEFGIEFAAHDGNP
jgi:hypothetical protein